MAALTKDRATPYRDGIELDFPVAGNTKIYAGSLVCANATGYAVPGADTTGLRFVGVALEQADNTSGANGAMTIRLRRSGAFQFDAASINQAMIGNPMYAVDDHTMDDTTGSAHNVRIGVLVKYVSDTQGWVDISA